MRVLLHGLYGAVSICFYIKPATVRWPLGTKEEAQFVIPKMR
jgi:hypothetical protein